MRYMLVALCFCIAGHASAAQDPLEQVREDLAAGKLRRTITAADSLRQAGLGSPELRRLEGDALWIAGSSRVLDAADSLRADGDDLGADILLLKIDLMLGRPQIHADLDRLQAAHPDEPELRLVRWLLDLDAGDWEGAAQSAEDVAASVACSFVTPAALLAAAVDRDSAAVALALPLMERSESTMFRKLRSKLTAGAVRSGPCRIDGDYELPYVDCGPLMGLRTTSTEGHELTLTIDTGTAAGLLTLHATEPGEALDGPVILRLENGIHYHYMPEPVDVVCKLVDFSEPPMSRCPVEYFDGDIDESDGCVSPFAFQGAALTVDPEAKRVWLRDRDGLAEYMRGLDPERIAVVPYVRRCGWIFVPARVNGHEVLMMVESGSRDVNVNTLAARRLGIDSRDDTVEWRGRDFPVKRADLTVEIGGLTYHCPDALVDDFVLGNNRTGTACAGDLGPDFLRHYRFTVDPFEGRLVLEEL